MGCVEISNNDRVWEILYASVFLEGKEREEAEALAVTISAEIAKQIAPYSDGVYLMTPFKRVSLMARILKEIR